ncbi:hypothetical protein FI667_g10279, partial [Globisporangium splendens]
MAPPSPASLHNGDGTDDDALCEKLRQESCRGAQARHGALRQELAAARAVLLGIADIALHERQLKQAEEVLSLVNWLLVKDRQTAPLSPTTAHANGRRHEDVSEEMKNLYVIRMNKLYSVLLMEYDAFTEALQRVSHGAYHCSLLFGPEHLYTSELYFCLGSIFSKMQQQASNNAKQQQRDQENALGVFDKVVDIWYRFLTNPPEDTAAWMLEHQRLRIYEASKMLQHIATMRSNALECARYVPRGHGRGALHTGPDLPLPG